LALPDNIRQNIKRRFIGMIGVNRWPRHVEQRELHIIFKRDIAVFI